MRSHFVKALLVITAIALLTGCGKKAEEETKAAMSVAEEQTKAPGTYIVTPDSFSDVTLNVTGTADGVIFLSADGMSSALGLEYGPASENEEASIEKASSEYDMLFSKDLPCITLRNEAHRLTVSPGSTLCLLDGEPAFLPNPVMVKEDGTLGIPIAPVAFLFDYSSVNTDVNGDVTVIKITK